MEADIKYGVALIGGQMVALILLAGILALFFRGLYLRTAVALGKREESATEMRYALLALLPGWMLPALYAVSESREADAHIWLPVGGISFLVFGWGYIWSTSPHSDLYKRIAGLCIMIIPLGIQGILLAATFSQ